jgi:hypothetical protein
MASPDVGDRAGRRRAFSASETTRWAVTLTATTASMYALDAFATAAGVLLVASRLLNSLDRVPVLLFLAGTYVVWGAGLQVNLRANWALLEGTGTSTNALSKAAHDLVKLRTGSVRARRIASAVGYVGTEIAKETPYYAGAFGVAVLSDSVTAHEALVFLGGANLGAAGYEYGLARLTRAFLDRGNVAPAYATFEKEWVPREYLADYYSVVEPDERHTIAFFVDVMRDLEADGRPQG